MEIYIDVVLIENFIINFFLLLVTTQIIKLKGEYKRLIIASFIGSLYTLLMFIPEVDFLVSLPIKLIMALLMLYIVIGKKDIIFYVKSYFCFILLSLSFCGICFAFALAQNPYSFNAGFTINNYLFRYLLFSIMIMYILTNRIVLFIKDRISFSKLIYDLDINYEGISYRVKGFLDTGNALIEPVTSLPVIIVEKKYLNNIQVKSDKCYHIPYKVVNGYSDKLLGIKVDEIKVYKNKGEVEHRKAIVCLCDTKLSNNNEFGALLSRGVI